MKNPNIILIICYNNKISWMYIHIKDWKYLNIGTIDSLLFHVHIIL